LEEVSHSSPSSNELSACFDTGKRIESAEELGTRISVLFSGAWATFSTSASETSGPHWNASLRRAGEVGVTASAVVGAVQAYAKINSNGQWVDQSQQVNLNELFDQMSQKELEDYARDGSLPQWFTSNRI
jgi:hypothetical protein